jgi:hypothetical protein
MVVFELSVEALFRFGGSLDDEERILESLDARCFRLNRR